VLLALTVMFTVAAWSPPPAAGAPPEPLVLSDESRTDARPACGDHFTFGKATWKKSWRGHRPRRDGDRVEFRYRDRGYESVKIAGSFNGWSPETMKLDEANDLWTVRIDLDTGVYRYHFVVRDSSEKWFAIDPGNPETIRDKKHGWVSLIVIDDGDIVRPRHRRARIVDDEFDREHERGLPEGATYQRVDGLFISALPRHVGKEPFEPSVQGMIGYGFKSERWGASLTVLQPLVPSNRLLLRASAHSKTDFTDQTGIDTDENTIAAIFFKDDYRDYYRREGASFSAVLNGADWLRLEGGIRTDDFESMRPRTDWSFGGGSFPLNPAIDEGTMRSVFGEVGLGTRWNRVDVSYERSADDLLGGEFEFERITAQSRSRLRINRDQRLDFRVRLGTNLSGSLPVQKRYVAGGLGTVRGYDYRSLLVTHPDAEGGEDAPVPFGGERILLANAEYTFGIYDDFGLILFYDAGMVWENRNADMDVDELKSSAGVGLKLDDEGLRVNIIRPMDRGDRDILVQLRIERMF